MILWSLCAFIWFKNIEKMLLQMTSGFLQLESTIFYLFTLITKLNHIINGIKWSALLIFLVAYKINSEISLM
jgi:hypothetical protein